jgi:prepilin-type N-terminal cleavage/methylation domain-containing protein
MRRRLSRTTRGVTLPEVLAAIMVLSVIAGTITAIYMTAMRTWYTGAAETYAEQKAYWAVHRMVPDFQQGMGVTPATSPYDNICIAIRLPMKVYDSGEGVYLNHIATDIDGKPYLVPGDWAIYFRGDEYGNIALDGDRIWRRYVRASDGAALKQDVIADNIVDNPDDGTGSPQPMFIYWPDIYRLRSVEVTVTAQEERGSRTATKTMNAELALRNN